MNIIEHPPAPVAGISERELNNLRRLDEMERLVLGQLALVRQERRAILLKHGIPTYKSTSKILVIDGEDER